MTLVFGALARCDSVSARQEDEAMAGGDPDQEKQAILAVIEEEFAGFFARDFDRYARCWLHVEDSLRLVTLAGGQIAYLQGWEAEAAMTRRLFEGRPTPNETDPALVRRENVRIRVSGDMAWASFDQHGPDTDDLLMDVGLTHQVRILEKDEGRWKIVYVGHADPKVGTFVCPTVRVDRTGAILWMNAAAKSELADHPVLAGDGGYLLARSRADNTLLRAALAATDDLTPVDVRRSGAPTDGVLGAIPLVLGEGCADQSHVVWVMYQDQMILVSFNDKEAERKRLSAARTLYGLSRGQARVAASIVEGHDIVKAAELMGISANTARTHLQRMFDKTGVRSQTALVRVLLSASTPTS